MTKKGYLSAALSQFDKRAGDVEDAAPTQPKAEPASKPRPALEATASRKPPSRQGKKALTGYFDPEVLKQLKVMAASEDTTIQALLAEALNELFKKHGKPHIA
jgi:hypothetical protein